MRCANSANRRVASHLPHAPSEHALLHSRRTRHPHLADRGRSRGIPAISGDREMGTSRQCRLEKHFRGGASPSPTHPRKLTRQMHNELHDRHVVLSLCDFHQPESVYCRETTSLPDPEGITPPVGSHTTALAPETLSTPPTLVKLAENRAWIWLNSRG